MMESRNIFSSVSIQAIEEVKYENQNYISRLIGSHYEM